MLQQIKLPAGVLAAAALALTAQSAIAVEGAAAEPIKPHGAWRMDYADQSCRLLRAFGSGDDQVLLGLERFSPGDALYLSIASKSLKSLTEREVVSLHFGPDGFATPAAFHVGYQGDLPAIFASNGRLVPLPDQNVNSAALVPLKGKSGRKADKGAAPSQGGSAKFEIPTDTITPAQESAVTWLEVGFGKGQTIRLDLGSMGPPMKAMRACTDELTSHWGLPGGPSGPGSKAATAQHISSWVTDNDFPRSKLGQRAIVYFRVHVSAVGRPLESTKVKVIGDEKFGDIVCNNVLARARFSPATDGAGAPVESTYMSSVYFVS